VIDEPVLTGLIGGEPAVAIGILLDLLNGLPLCSAIKVAMRFLMNSICSAWILMSDAVPPMPPSGWCIMIRVFGVA
jgi:hypothetical protein